MILAAKLGLGLASTMVFATVYTFREGVIKVEVDELHAGGSHVHIWAPAAVVPLAMRFVPKRHFQHMPPEAKEMLPVGEVIMDELRRYPNTTFVDVQSGEQQVRVATVGRKIQIDVVDPEENVHVAVPIATVKDVMEQLAEQNRAD